MSLKNNEERASNAPTSSPTTLMSRVEENTFTNPFVFVDLIDGMWSVRRRELYELNPIIQCPIGGKVVFYYPKKVHDVVKMVDEDHYKRCDFTDSIELSPHTINSNYSYTTYYHNCSNPGALEYISCSIDGHCRAGQKIMIQTSDSVYAHDNQTGKMLLHVDSFSRLLKVMGHKVDPETGFIKMELGYQTEEIAEQTKEWIWCGLEHCPDYYDFGDNSNGVTESDCIGASNTLLGFIDRQKPIPDWGKAEDYYQKAIESGGINECAARSYVTKLFLDKGDYINASSRAIELCNACGNGEYDDVYGTSVRQAKADFDNAAIASNATLWPCAPTSAAATRSNESFMMMTMFFSLILMKKLF